MKRKFEDRLAELAFGDLSLEESMELESQVSKDPKHARKLSEFRTLKEDLRSFAEIPDHQLSNERLRDAILGQGLKPLPEQSNPWSWLWMPAVSCCAVALVLMAVRSHQPVSSQIVGNSLDIADRGNSRTPLNVGSTQKIADRSGSVEKPVVTHGPSLVARNDDHGMRNSFRLSGNSAFRGHHHRVANAFDPKLMVASYKYVEDLDGGSSTNSKATSLSPQPTATTAALKPIDGNTSDGDVVVIGTDKDQDTGAQTATEVGSAKNVVVGG